MGSTYCLKARARDHLGNLGLYSAGRCTAIPLKADQVTYTGAWTKSFAASAYGGFYFRTTALGAKITQSGIVAQRISLVATTCSSCGSVKVYWNGLYQKTVSLTAATTARKQIIDLLAFSGTATGTLTLVTTSGQPVLVEGLAISKTRA